MNNNFPFSESLQNAGLKNNTPKLNDNNVIDQNSYIMVTENVSSTKFSELFYSKVTEKEDVSRQTLYSDDKPGIESTLFQPRKSIPVEAVPIVQQNNSVNSFDLQKREKIVNDVPIENNINLINTLVSSEKRDVILDSVPTTGKFNIECSDILQKNNEANTQDIHSHQSDVYDDENMCDTVASNKVETFSSHTVVSESSKVYCESDYVGFNESHDSHQDCPSIVSTQSEIAECLLNTQKSFEEENPECTTSMEVDNFPQNQKKVVSKITNYESAHADCAEEEVLGRSFSDYEVESEHVADYSEKKRNWTSPHTDDAFEVNSDKLTKSVEMSPTAPSNLPSSVDDIKYNCRVLLYDVLGGKKRKHEQEEDEATDDSEDAKDDDPDYASNGLSSYEKMIEEKRAERIAFMKSIEIYKIKEEISEARNGIKQLKTDSVEKYHSFPSNVPIRRSKKLPNLEVHFSEKALQELAVKSAVISGFARFHYFKEVLKSKIPYEECINDLRVNKPKRIQEFITYDKFVFENMTIKEFHVRKVAERRNTCAAWYPSKEDLIVAAADTFGYLSLWKIQDSDTTPYLFSVHDGNITNIQFNSFDPVQLITSSFDGTILCGDLIKHTFNEIYRSDNLRVTWFDFLSPSTFLASHSHGLVAVFDKNTNRKTGEQRHACHDSMINTVSVHPLNKNIFVTCDNKKSIRLWDLRKLQKDPVVEILHHRNAVISAYFSPVAGNSILTSSLDNSICVFDSTKLTQDIKLTRMKNHNITSTRRFKATWLPDDDDLFAVGCMVYKQEQRIIQIYDKDLNLYHNMTNDKLHKVTLIQCFHPYRSALAGGDHGGRLYVFT